MCPHRTHNSVGSIDQVGYKCIRYHDNEIYYKGKVFLGGRHPSCFMPGPFNVGPNTVACIQLVGLKGSLVMFMARMCWAVPALLEGLPA